jgi:hypothetical protein
VDFGNSRWIVVRLYVDRVAAAITAAKPDTYAEPASHKLQPLVHRRTLLPRHRLFLPNQGESVRYDVLPMSQAVHNKYAVILTFPLSGNIAQKTNLPTICQLSDWSDGTTIEAFRGSVSLVTMLSELGPQK